MSFSTPALLSGSCGSRIGTTSTISPPQSGQGGRSPNGAQGAGSYPSDSSWLRQSWHSLCSGGALANLAPQLGQDQDSPKAFMTTPRLMQICRSFRANRTSALIRAYTCQLGASRIFSANLRGSCRCCAYGASTMAWMPAGIGIGLAAVVLWRSIGMTAELAAT
jgi:hypothetical protein